MGSSSSQDIPGQSNPPSSSPFADGRAEASQTQREGDLAESYRSTDTIRHCPDLGYGTIRGSVTPNPPDTTPARPSSSAAQAPASPYLGPERSKPTRPRKPAMSRKPSANPTLLRREVFSVDDDISEVEADAAERQREQQQSYTIRRRPHATPSLTRFRSSRLGDVDDDDDEEVPDVAQPAGEDEEDFEPGDAADDGLSGYNSEEDHSDAESFTLKDRQQAINQTHPFGIRLWKPALYKKNRSVQKTAEVDIHSTPGGHVSNWLLFFNLVWTLIFGWWLALIAAFSGIICFLVPTRLGGLGYGYVLWGLARYLFYPFGQLVRLEKDEAYVHEDRGEGRSIAEYEQWQNGDLEYGRLFFGPDDHNNNNRSIIGRSRRSIDSDMSETDSLLGRGRRGDHGGTDNTRPKRRLFGRGEWNVGRVLFFFVFYLLIAPPLIVVSLICWLLVFWIPMGKVTMLLLDHLRRHPLALSFESGMPSRPSGARHSTILLCTYRAVGPRYWKYTIDGTNIFLINLMAVVLFVVFDFIVLVEFLEFDHFITSSAFLFPAGLLSIIPLAYFIGQAVASISAQSSMGLGAAINAFFSTVVEVYLYCIALNQGKGQLVEGSIIGSIFAGILFLPGLSMCFGAIKRKTQRFNAKSAGVTSTMLIFAMIGAFSPTLFYQIYGSHEVNCLKCDNPGGQDDSLQECHRCFFSEIPTIQDRFYRDAVRPFCYMAACMLFLAYAVGLWFTLRTHAAVIWNIEVDEKKHDEYPVHGSIRQSGSQTLGDTTGTDIRETPLYKRILGQSLKHAGIPLHPEDSNQHNSSSSTLLGDPNASNATPHVVPPRPERFQPHMNIPGFSEAENNNLVREVAELAATAVTLAARDVRFPRRSAAIHAGSTTGGHGTMQGSLKGPSSRAGLPAETEEVGEAGPESAGGHDAPNWSRLKSSIILLGATILYAIIAEILVDSVDVVLNGFALDEKFLGITLFALVPNTTEFLNAISFAMNGNIALSMEIGSAYALQVCLLQIPALVFYSAIHQVSPLNDESVTKYTFPLIFPQWDMVTVILCVFLLSYMYGEGKSNYFKGSILLLSYLVVISGFFFSSYSSMEGMGIHRFDVDGESGRQYNVYRTVGRSAKGIVYL